MLKKIILFIKKIFTAFWQWLRLLWSPGKNAGKKSPGHSDLQEESAALLAQQIQDKERSYKIATEISNEPGLVCPRCRHRITISIQMILSGQPIFCHNCLLELNVDPGKSSEAIKALEKLQSDFDKANSMVKDAQN